ARANLPRWLPVRETVSATKSATNSRSRKSSRYRTADLSARLTGTHDAPFWPRRVPPRLQKFVEREGRWSLSDCERVEEPVFAVDVSGGRRSGFRLPRVDDQTRRAGLRGIDGR